MGLGKGTGSKLGSASHWLWAGVVIETFGALISTIINGRTLSQKCGTYVTQEACMACC